MYNYYKFWLFFFKSVKNCLNICNNKLRLQHPRQQRIPLICIPHTFCLEQFLRRNGFFRAINEQFSHHWRKTELKLKCIFFFIRKGIYKRYNQVFFLPSRLPYFPFRCNLLVQERMQSFLQCYSFSGQVSSDQRSLDLRFYFIENIKIVDYSFAFSNVGKQKPFLICKYI